MKHVILLKPAVHYVPEGFPKIVIRKIGMFRHVFAMFWNPSVSLLNIRGVREPIDINLASSESLLRGFVIF